MTMKSSTHSSTFECVETTPLYIDLKDCEDSTAAAMSIVKAKTGSTGIRCVVCSK